MSPYNVFDACCMVGRHMKLEANGPHSAADLLAEMDHFGIAEALVVDSLSRENHPVDGNARILDVVKPHPRLHPAWAVLPHGASDEQPAPADLLAAMRRNHVGALYLYPQQYKINLSEWSVDAFLAPLAATGVPLFIVPNEVGAGGNWAWDQTDWSAVVALCQRFPRLPVIVSEFRIRRANRTIYRAFDACPNLHLELSGYWLHHGIEYITRRWGARRLLFGSNWPRLGQGPTLATLTCAEISDADKRLIAGDNLRRLIAWAAPTHPPVALPPPADEFVAFAQTGQRPASMTFADNHGHLGGRACHYHLPDCELAPIVTEMTRLGVEKTCVFSICGVFSDECFGNDLVAAAVQRYPDRFVGFTLINPHRGRDEILRELDRGDALGLRGIKLIPHYQQYPEEGPMIDVICQWANERRRIILNHYWGPARHLERLVSSYPQMCFFTGHSTEEYAAFMPKYPNLYVCSCPLHLPRHCEKLVAAIGADRLMFGSDLQDLPIAWGLGPILFARLPVAAKRLILGENLRRVLTQYP